MSGATNELSAERLRERRAATVKYRELKEQWRKAYYAMPAGDKRDAITKRLNAEAAQFVDAAYPEHYTYEAEVDALLVEVERLQALTAATFAERLAACSPVALRAAAALLELGKPAPELIAGIDALLTDSATRTTGRCTMDELVYLDFVSLFSGVRQQVMPLRDALEVVAVLRTTGHQWAIHRQRDQVLIAETRGMKQAVIDAFASGLMK